MNRPAPPTGVPGGGVNLTDTEKLLPCTGRHPRMTQFEGQSSPSTVLPSSQVSPGSTMPFPQPTATGGSCCTTAVTQASSICCSTTSFAPGHGPTASALSKAAPKELLAFPVQAESTAPVVAA